VCGLPVKLKRAYDPPAPEDGRRYLVERLWPRGVKKDALALTDWLKDVAPSTGLRRWYGHEPERLPEFVRRYRQELSAPGSRADLARLAQEAQDGTITLVFSTRDVELSGAKVLASLIEELIDRGTL
jgi:uncharacterized protein YeaO (DUF488 family)